MVMRREAKEQIKLEVHEISKQRVCQRAFKGIENPEIIRNSKDLVRMMGAKIKLMNEYLQMSTKRLNQKYWSDEFFNDICNYQ